MAGQKKDISCDFGCVSKHEKTEMAQSTMPALTQSSEEQNLKMLKTANIECGFTLDLGNVIKHGKEIMGNTAVSRHPSKDQNFKLSQLADMRQHFNPDLKIVKIEKTELDEAGSPTQSSENNDHGQTSDVILGHQDNIKQEVELTCFTESEQAWSLASQLLTRYNESHSSLHSTPKPKLKSASQRCIAASVEGKKKQASFTLDFKLKIIEEVESGVSRSEACRRYGLPKSTLATILRNKDVIKRSVETSEFQPQRKRMRRANNEDLENALLAWFKHMRACNYPVNGPVLCMKAQEFAQEMGLDQFTATSGWFDRFKHRKGITQKHISGESDYMSPGQVQDWKTSVLASILQDYAPEDIYSADETGLFYRCLPGKGKICLGGKSPKERLTVMVAANMTGTDKLPLLVIGKNLHPRCFKNVKRLPVEYNADKQAWMTSVIFEKWIRTLDRKMSNRGKQIVLFVDSCPAHPPLDNLKAIKLVFFPPKTASVLEPCSQGIVRNLKHQYRIRILKRYITHLEQSQSRFGSACPFNISLIDALYILRLAWHSVSESCIANCFTLAGFKQTVPPELNEIVEESESSHQQPNAEGNGELRSLWSKLSSLIQIGKETISSYMTIDDNVAVFGKALSNGDICDIVLNVKKEKMDEEEVSPLEEVHATPTVSEARSALSLIKKYLSSYEGDDKDFDILIALEEAIEKCSAASQKHKTV